MSPAAQSQNACQCHHHAADPEPRDKGLDPITGCPLLVCGFIDGFAERHIEVMCPQARHRRFCGDGAAFGIEAALRHQWDGGGVVMGDDGGFFADVVILPDVLHALQFKLPRIERDGLADGLKLDGFLLPQRCGCGGGNDHRHATVCQHHGQGVSPLDFFACG